MKWTCVTLLWAQGCMLVGPDASDGDGDGFVAVRFGGDDCDDDAPDVHPGAPEIAGDGVDQDCDGAELCHADADADGLGGSALVTLRGADCHGGAREGGDCDDADPALQRRRYHADADADGHGDPEVWVEACAPPAGHVDDDLDCDDADPALPRTFYVDADHDGVGAGEPVLACAAPTGAVEVAGDCDDDDPARRPGGVETCGDGVDQDCDPSPRVCGLWGAVDAADADARWWGDEAPWQLGAALHGRADVTGDGTPDLVIGAPGGWRHLPSAGSGAVWVASGRELVGTGPASSLWDVVYGELGHALGSAVYADATLGELLIGEPGYTDAQGEVGAVARFALPLWYADEPERVVGAPDGGTLGRGVTVAWPTGGAAPHVLVRGADRYDADDLVGWIDATSWTGRERLADRASSPPTSGVLRAEADVEVVDLAAGPAPSGHGDAWAYAFLGAERLGVAWVLSLADTYEAPLEELPRRVLDAPYRAASGGERAAVRVARDLTGDGRADLAVGLSCAPSSCPRRGDVWVVPGSADLGPGHTPLDEIGHTRPGFHLQGPTRGGLFGAALADVGDVDGDGHDDLAVGLSSDGTVPGAVFLLYGPLPEGAFHVDDVGVTLPGARIAAPDATSWRILTLAGVADVDGDGCDELAIGAPVDRAPDGADLAGQVWVWHGRGDG